MAWSPRKPAAEVIWQHDNELLQKAIRFYQALRADVRPQEGGVLQAERDPEERGAAGRLRRRHLGADPRRAPRLRGGQRAARAALHGRRGGEVLRLPRGVEPRRHHPGAPQRPGAAGAHEEGARAAAGDEGGRARRAVRRDALPAGGAGAAAVRHRGHALREGPAALHHRGHEDVQHRPRAVLRHGRQGRHDRRRRDGRAEGAAALQDHARREVRRRSTRRQVERERRARTSELLAARCS